MDTNPSETAPTRPTGNGGAIETELSRDIGLVTALAIGAGTMIAAGIFTPSGLAVGYVGSAAIASFLVAAVVALFTALTYCEFTSIYPQSGEGYLCARKTFAPPLAYLVGWCLVLGQTASCGFYVASLSSYFNEFVWHSPVEQASGLVALVGLVLLNIKGTKESGTFQVVITVAKVILLLWFCVGGLPHVSTEQVIERFSTDMMMIGSTAALVFITFFGFSAIAASAGEVRNPTKTIPRAIFLSMGIVTVLYTLVVDPDRERGAGGPGHPGPAAGLRRLPGVEGQPDGGVGNDPGRRPAPMHRRADSARSRARRRGQRRSACAVRPEAQSPRRSSRSAVSSRPQPSRTTTSTSAS